MYWQLLTTAYLGMEKYKAGQAEMEAYNDQAQEEERVASLIQQDMKKNSKLLARKGDQFAKEQQADYAASGVDISTGAPLSAMEDTISAVQEQISIDRRNAMARSDQAKFAAKVSRKNARNSDKSFVESTISALTGGR